MPKIQYQQVPIWLNLNTPWSHICNSNSKFVLTTAKTKQSML